MGRIAKILGTVVCSVMLCTGIAVAENTGFMTQLSQSEHFDLSLVTILFIVLMGYGWAKQRDEIR